LRAHHNAHMAALADRGLRDIGSPHLLVTLSHYPNDPDQAPTQKELADRLHCAPPTIAASLKCLERQGYVARRTDEKDSRRNRISITQKGRDALTAGMRAFQQVDDHMYHGFSPEERELVYQFHQRMLDNLYQIGGRREDDSCPPPPPPPESLERKCDPC
ncbi:MAG: MarR family winged helix-turn-helix transcriptional regulator, partial [Oscillospiraceae bacterium]|nr:MarR family winged helix-turn-helix transcriptional regulator [Oscillospiraceae bacterium]